MTGPNESCSVDSGLGRMLALALLNHRVLETETAIQGTILSRVYYETRHQYFGCLLKGIEHEDNKVARVW